MIINKNRGISLIVLVITIIVIIILAGAIILSLSATNPIEKANKATFLSDVSNFKTELSLYETQKFTDNMGLYNPKLLQADEATATYSEVVLEDTTINDLIISLGKKAKYAGQFKITDGELVYQGSDTNMQTWANEIGIPVDVAGAPKVTIIPPTDTVVGIGTDIVYTIKFSSNVVITDINLLGKIEVLDDVGVALPSQPVISIGAINGVGMDTTIQVDITIKTNTMSNGTYKLKIKAESVTNANDISNTLDTISLTGFDINNISLQNPVMSANVAEWTNGNVTVTINYSVESTIKEYSIDGTNWSSYTVPVVVTTNNTTVYARGKDSLGNESGVATITVTKIDKTVPTVAYGTNGGSGETVSTTVTVSDVGGSNINTSTLQYIWDTQNVTTPASGWATFTNNQTLTKTGVNGTYYLWIKASDNAGNNVISKTNSFTLTQPEVLNKPVLSTGMTAKKWNGSSWVTVSNPDTDTSWYNYGSKQWANAQTADGSMWVWIPRYEYKIPTPHSSAAQTIAVNFLNGTSITATSGYTVHPAFTFGSTQLTGIWVAKFEASGSTSAVDVKPGIASLRSITIDAMYTACRNMETTYGARYGWGTSGTGIDTHLIKNTEWGAVAYLSSSTYGKTGEVWINPNSNYITGQAGTSVSASGTTSTYSYDNVTYGVNASTTGNISGIYDMSGGAYEYTAAYVNNGNGNLTTYGSSLVSAISQYKDIYTVTTDDYTNNYNNASNKKGDVVYETSTGWGSTSWYSDYSYMPYSSSPFFVRGGYCSGTAGAGVFGFSNTDGGAISFIGFRPVLVLSVAL